MSPLGWLTLSALAGVVAFWFRQARQGEVYSQRRDMLVGALFSIFGLLLLVAGVQRFETIGVDPELLALFGGGLVCLAIAPLIVRQVHRREQLMRSGAVAVGEILGPILGQRGPCGVAYAFIAPDGVRRQGRSQNLTAEIVKRLVETGRVPVVYNPSNPEEHEGDVYGTRAAEVGLSSPTE